MRYLAIDYGLKRTGLAVCDQAETLASPLEVIEGSRDIAVRIARAVKEHQAGAVVVGLPLNMDGSRGPQAKKTLELAAQLEKRLDVPVHLQDERLSSYAASEKLQHTQLSRKKKIRRLDAVAAAQILEDFLAGRRQTP